MQTVKQKLDDVIARLFEPIATKDHWQVSGAGNNHRLAWLEYHRDNIALRFENDFGLLTVAIGPLNQTDERFDVSMVHDIISPPRVGRTHFSLEEGIAFVCANRELLIQMLSPANWRSTRLQLLQAGSL